MSEVDLVKNRSELVFIYDVKDGNPNGDPADENKPRIDEFSGINIVTDVRLKRTIRDYLEHYKGCKIFVKKVEKTADSINTAKDRAKEFANDPNKILAECIDIRLFGGTIPIERKSKKKSSKSGETSEEKIVGDSITFTGPVQFTMGRSYHRVQLKYIKGTGAFASSEGKKQQTFREEWILPYSLIGFYGIINENAAEDTKLTKQDIELLFEAIWNGTNNLITRSKMLHIPRLLLQVEMKEKNFHIGELHNKITLIKECDDEELRSTSDFIIDITKLIDAISGYSDRVKQIRYKISEELNFVYKGTKITFAEALDKTGCSFSEFNF